MKDNKFSSGNEQFEALCKSDPKICQALLSLDPVRAYDFKQHAWVGWHARIADFDRVTAERDAALADVERLDNALNVTDAAAEKWLSDLTKARELFELILDDPRLVVAMSSDILVPIKSLISVKSEPFESNVSALQQRLTAADERADVLEGLLHRVVDSSVLSFEQDAPEALESLEADICAALKTSDELAAQHAAIDFFDAALKPAEAPTLKAKPTCRWACTGCNICGSAGHDNSWS